MKLCVVHNKQKNVREDFLAYPEAHFFYSSESFRTDESYAMLTIFTVDIQEPRFNTLQRILGVQCCNLRRILHMAHKQIDNLVNSDSQKTDDLEVKIYKSTHQLELVI